MLIYGNWNSADGLSIMCTDFYLQVYTCILFKVNKLVFNKTYV